jgi:hypothetical protein
VLAHDRLDSLGSLVGVVEGDAADVVVEDVSLDDTVEKVSADKTHLTIDSGSGTADKVPLVVGVVGKSRIGVLEEGNSNYKGQYLLSKWNGSKLTEPVVNPKVGNEVPDGHVVEAKLLNEEVQSGTRQGDTNVAQDDELGVAVLVKRAAGIEVVDTATETVVLALATALLLTLVVVVASNVGHEVVGPADQLLENKHDQSEGGSLLSEVGKLVGHLAETSSLLLASSGDKDHVTLHVSGSLVVLSVGDLPAEVGDEERRVENPAGDVVDEAGVRESTVATLVSNDPETGTEKTLENSIDGPETSAGGGAGDVLGGHIVVPDTKGGGKEDNVAKDVSVSLESGALETMLGNGIVDLLDGEVGNLELVAVGVEHNTIFGLGLGNVDLGER